MRRTPIASLDQARGADTLEAAESATPIAKEKSKKKSSGSDPDSRRSVSAGIGSMLKTPIATAKASVVASA
jgi:hypothetical protein